MEQLQLSMDLDLEVAPPALPPSREVELLPLNDYDNVILNISGGADSMGCLFELKKQGLDFSKLELWHQCVDGRGEQYHEFWDWPCTESYIESVGQYFDVPVYYQWRDRGIYGELMRENQLAVEMYFIVRGWKLFVCRQARERTVPGVDFQLKVQISEFAGVAHLLRQTRQDVYLITQLSHLKNQNKTARGLDLWLI